MNKSLHLISNDVRWHLSRWRSGTSDECFSGTRVHVVCIVTESFTESIFFLVQFISCHLLIKTLQLIFVMFHSTRRSLYTPLCIDFQQGRPHQILFTSWGRAVLYAGELIHTALKYVQPDEKWGVRSSLCALLQIGSNFFPLMFLPLSLFSLSPPLSSATEASAHYPPEVWCATSVFQSMWWWQRWRRGRDEFSVVAAEEVGALIPQFYKMPGALGTSHAVLFNVWC